MKTRAIIAALAGLCWPGLGLGAEAAATNAQMKVVIVVGAAGEEEYGKQFEKWTASWEMACEKGGAEHVTIGTGPTNAATDLDQLRKLIESEPRETRDPLWLVMIGHGTFDGREAKFNLRGPDVAATNLATWLKPFKRPVAIIDCSASSAPFINRLSAPDRVIITSTRSGAEQNYSRFGQYLAEAITAPEADLDKDGQTSLLEAYLMASRQVGEFYEGEGRLTTEHALLDDNGDGLGTPADWFRGIRPVKRAKEGAGLDGLRAHQFHLVKSAQELNLPPEARAKRDELELQVLALRETKAKFTEDEYYRKLEVLLVQLARISEQVPAASR